MYQNKTANAIFYQNKKNINDTYVNNKKDLRILHVYENMVSNKPNESQCS